MTKYMSQILGKILLIDDYFDEVINNAVSALVKEGMSVQFWDSKGDFPCTISNVRVVIIDLELVKGAGVRTKTADYYYPAAEILTKVPGPFFVIIMAQEYEEDDPANLDYYYKQFFPTLPLCGVILKKGLRKDEELNDSSKLVDLIKDSITKERILRLILIWEAVIEKAQDKAFSDVVSHEVKDTIDHLIKSLCRDFGEESASREFMGTMAQLISRRLYETPEFKELDLLIKEINLEKINNKEYPREEDLAVYNKLMYYKPDSNEAVWTGDIYRTVGLPYGENYAIVLTPVCNLVNHEKSKNLSCMGFPLDELAFCSPKYPLYELDPAAAKKLKTVDGLAIKIPYYLEDRYVKGKSTIPENFYLLWNFIDKGKTFGLCFDFNNVKTITDQDTQTWERVLRLDWPFIQQVLEKYGRYVSRVGIPEINLSKEKLREKFELQNPDSADTGGTKK